MGYYIETTCGGHKGKAQHFIKEHGAGPMTAPEFIDPSTGYVTVCVVDNGAWEAALVCYDERQFARTMNPHDLRPRRHLRMKCDVVAKLGPPELTSHILPETAK